MSKGPSKVPCDLLFNKFLASGCIEKVSKNVFGKLLKSIFPTITKNSVYHPTKPFHVYKGISIQESDKENEITKEDISSNAALFGFHRISESPPSYAVFTDIIHQGNRLLKEISFKNQGIVWKSEITLGGVDATDLSIDLNNHVFNSVKQSNICIGFENANISGGRERASTCTGHYAQRQSSKLCLSCYNRQNYIVNLKDSRKRKIEISVDELQEDSDSEEHGVIDYSESEEEEEEEVSNDDIQNDPTYNPFTIRRIKATSCFSPEDTERLVDEVVSAAPALDNPCARQLLTSQIKNGSKKVKTKHDWDAR